MIDLYKITSSSIIGIIEDITEFLPISSTGHIIILSHWLKIDNNNTKMLENFIQLGSALAIFCFFYKTILKIIKFKIDIVYQKTNIIHIIIAISPTIFIGLLLHKKIKLLLNVNNVMHGLIYGSIFLLISELLKPKQTKTNTIDNISLFQSMIIGCLQICSLYPGFSRSGSTIATGILLGIKKSVAIEFSFIISIPLLIGASVFNLINNIDYIDIMNIPILFTSFIISFIVSLLCINMLLNFFKNTSLIVFVVYRLLISGLIYFTN